MNFVTFIDNRFQELRLKESAEEARKEYSVTRDAEVMALQFVLTTFRSLVKWVYIPKVIFHFFLVKIGYARKPVPVLVNQLKETQQKELEKKAKKVGMLQAVKPEQSDAEVLPNPAV